jgi:dihydroorotate dehydrogenase electron transfer subunit
MVGLVNSALHSVRAVVDLGGGSFVVEVEGPIPETMPGQFYMLRPEAPWPSLLPRPFSLFERSADGGMGSFLMKAIGPATRWFARLRRGDRLWLTGPLGNRFPEPAQGEAPMGVAGGVGLAPFLLHAQERARHGDAPVEMLFGARTEAGLAGHDRFDPRWVRWHLATEDGSSGARGTVIDLMAEAERAGRLSARTPVYCCGPDGMMHAVAKFCAARGIACWLSLETYMGCGYGVCNGCSVRVRRPWPYAKACAEGPVFAASELA